MVILALTLNAKSLLFLIGAIIFGLLAGYGLLRTRETWWFGVAWAAFCLGFIGFFIWAAGG